MNHIPVASIRESENAHLIHSAVLILVVVFRGNHWSSARLATVHPSVMSLAEISAGGRLLCFPNGRWKNLNWVVRQAPEDLVLGVVRHGKLYRVNNPGVDTLEIGSGRSTCE
ncbi:MAG: hypothetical protein U1U88_002035 [Lawsonella clevelandensis]